jgi:hypothetical protein
MITLRRECFTREWIDRKSLEIRTGNTFLEKCLHAFELLGRLQQEGLDFVFKGGTSLLLRLPDPKRLSIDIDILCKERSDRLERILGECVSTPFTGHDEDARRHNHPPRRRHWNFSYHSISPDSCPEPYVILDVLEEDVLYNDVTEIEIQAPFIETDHAIRVKVPTIDNLLADKLAAFAPNTIGQKYGPTHPEKIAKHFFDIGELFDHAESIHEIKGVYRRIAAAEIGYRNNERALNINQCLDDTIETAQLVAGLAIGQQFHTDNSTLLRRGIDQLSGHLIGISFGPRDAAIATAKAAYLAAAIKNDNMRQIDRVRFDPSRIADLTNATIESRPVLNRLKAISPEAFYYWHLTAVLEQ